MLKEYKNKKVKTEKTKKTKYTIPDKGVVIEASSLAEAQAIYEKEYPSSENEADK